MTTDGPEGPARRGQPTPIKRVPPLPDADPEEGAQHGRPRRGGFVSPDPPVEDFRLARPSREEIRLARPPQEGPHDPWTWVSWKSGDSSSKSWSPGWSREVRDTTVLHFSTDTGWATDRPAWIRVRTRPCHSVRSHQH